VDFHAPFCLIWIKSRRARPVYHFVVAFPAARRFDYGIADPWPSHVKFSLQP